MKKYRVVSNILIVAMLLSLIMFVFNINGNYVFSYNNPKVIYSGNSDSKKVSFMINVYWGNECIDDILCILKENEVKTTFFVGGSWAVKYPEILKKIYANGHEIANHGYFHKDQDKLSYQQNYDEIKKCHEVIKSIIDVDMNLFAPPSGAFNKSTLEACENLGYKAIMWTYDTIDWRDKDADLIYKRATKDLKGGNLILSHPTEHTLKALPKILKFYKDNGFTATTVSDTLSVNGI